MSLSPHRSLPLLSHTHTHPQCSTPLHTQQVQPGPGPEEVNWESLWFNHSQRRLRQFVTTPFAILVVFAPVSLLTSAISSLNSTFCQAVKFEFYCESKSPISNIIRGLVTGFLPSLLIILWQVGMQIRSYHIPVCSGRVYTRWFPAQILILPLLLIICWAEGYAEPRSFLPLYCILYWQLASASQWSATQCSATQHAAVN